MRGAMKPESHTPRDDSNSIGSLAIELGYITQEELTAAVRVQQQRLPLGRILVEMGKLTEKQLEDLVFELGIRRGEIKDKDLIRQYRRTKIRDKMTQIKDGFKAMQEETRRLTDSVFSTTQEVRFKMK